MDEAKLEQFMGTMVGHMTGAMACFGVWLGDLHICLSAVRFRP